MHTLSMSGAAVRQQQQMTYKLTPSDRGILKMLLNPDGGISSSHLSRKLGIPQTTVQRRRKRLEKDIVKMSYMVDFEKLGWRRADLFISTRNGKTSSVARKLLSSDVVTYVGRSIGENGIDLRAEV